MNQEIEQFLCNGEKNITDDQQGCMINRHIDNKVLYESLTILEELVNICPLFKEINAGFLYEETLYKCFVRACKEEIFKTQMDSFEKLPLEEFPEIEEIEKRIKLVELFEDKGKDNEKEDKEKKQIDITYRIKGLISIINKFPWLNHLAFIDSLSIISEYFLKEYSNKVMEYKGLMKKIIKLNKRFNFYNFESELKEDDYDIEVNYIEYYFYNVNIKLIETFLSSLDPHQLDPLLMRQRLSIITKIFKIDMNCCFEEAWFDIIQLLTQHSMKNMDFFKIIINKEKKDGGDKECVKNNINKNANLEYTIISLMRRHAWIEDQRCLASALFFVVLLKSLSNYNCDNEAIAEFFLEFTNSNFDLFKPSHQVVFEEILISLIFKLPDRIFGFLDEKYKNRDAKIMHNFGKNLTNLQKYLKKFRYDCRHVGPGVDSTITEIIRLELKYNWKFDGLYHSSHIFIFNYALELYNSINSYKDCPKYDYLCTLLHRLISTLSFHLYQTDCKTRYDDGIKIIYHETESFSSFFRLISKIVLSEERLKSICDVILFWHKMLKFQFINTYWIDICKIIGLMKPSILLNGYFEDLINCIGRYLIMLHNRNHSRKLYISDVASITLDLYYDIFICKYLILLILLDPSLLEPDRFIQLNRLFQVYLDVVDNAMNKYYEKYKRNDFGFFVCMLIHNAPHLLEDEKMLQERAESLIDCFIQSSKDIIVDRSFNIIDESDRGKIFSLFEIDANNTFKDLKRPALSFDRQELLEAIFKYQVGSFLNNNNILTITIIKKFPSILDADRKDDLRDLLNTINGIFTKN